MLIINIVRTVVLLSHWVSEASRCVTIGNLAEGEDYSYSFFVVNVIAKWKSGMAIRQALMVRLKL